MTKKYDVLVFIGRFQPVHNAHAEIIKRAQEMAQKVVIILGSDNKPRTYKNPFMGHERYVMLLQLVGQHSNVSILSVEDSLYNDVAWAAAVQRKLAPYVKNGAKVGIIGHRKDDSSFYFDLFPQLKFEEVELIEPLNATDVRDLYFRKNCNMNFIKNVVPETTYEFLKDFKQTDDYTNIIEEREFIEKYKKQYASLEFPPTFITTDAVVIQSGHVLMIKRRAFPGKGLWALPGGFLDAATDRNLKECMLRELKEETGIKVPVPVLAGSITDVKVFDALSRSERGRTVTHAYKIMLPDGELPKVKGGDDAEKAKWIPIGELDPSKCYEDHYEIIQTFVGA